MKAAPQPVRHLIGVHAAPGPELSSDRLMGLLLSKVDGNRSLVELESFARVLRLDVNLLEVLWRADEWRGPRPS